MGKTETANEVNADRFQIGDDFVVSASLSYSINEVVGKHNL